MASVLSPASEQFRLEEFNSNACLNCSVKFTVDGDGHVETHKIQFLEVLDGEQETVSVWTALNVVFKIPINRHVNEKEGADFGCCSGCSTLLCQLYDLYWKLESMRNVESVISKMLEVNQAKFESTAASKTDSEVDQDQGQVSISSQHMIRPEDSLNVTESPCTQTQASQSKSQSEPMIVPIPVEGFMTNKLQCLNCCVQLRNSTETAASSSVKLAVGAVVPITSAPGTQIPNKNKILIPDILNYVLKLPPNNNWTAGLKMCADCARKLLHVNVCFTNLENVTKPESRLSFIFLQMRNFIAHGYNRNWKALSSCTSVVSLPAPVPVVEEPCIVNSNTRLRRRTSRKTLKRKVLQQVFIDPYDSEAANEAKKDFDIERSDPLDISAPVKDTGSRSDGDRSIQDQMPAKPITSSCAGSSSLQPTIRVTGRRSVGNLVETECETGDKSNNRRDQSKVFDPDNEYQKTVDILLAALPESKRKYVPTAESIAKYYKRKKEYKRTLPVIIHEPCPHCGIVLKAKNKNALKNHINFRHNYIAPGVGYICSICAKPLQNKTFKQNHEKTHLSADERAKLREKEPPQTWLCPQCGATLSSEYSLNKHIEKHEMSDESRRLHCEDTNCTYTCLDKNSMKRHMKEFHDPTVQPKHRCKVCNQGFRLFSELKVHQMNVCDTSDRPFACDQGTCVRKFKHKQALMTHLHSVHTMAPEEARQKLYPDLDCPDWVGAKRKKKSKTQDKRKRFRN